MDTIANMVKAAFMRGRPSQQPQAPVQQPAPVSAFMEPIPVEGRLTFGRMPKHVAFTPAQQAEIDAWEASDTNRGELERALRDERRPDVLNTLASEYAKLFGAFDPQGAGYDYEGAVAAGLRPEKGHWPSRDPMAGRIFKGAGHPTFHKTIDGERAAGMVMRRDIEDGRYYSNPPVRGR